MIITYYYHKYISSERFVRAGYIKLVLPPYVRRALHNSDRSRDHRIVYSGRH